MSRILLTIPTWNEATCIERNVRQVLAFCERALVTHDWLIEVADNGSTDETRAIVRRLSSEEPRLALREVQERGKGGAIQASWLAHREDADAFVFLDADLAADLAALPRLIEPILSDQTDLVCGSRFQVGAEVERSFLRERLSRVYRILQNAMLHLPVRDAQCGFKAASRRVVADVLPHVCERKWLFDTELIARTHARGFLIVELPVRWIEHRDVRRRSALRVWRDGWDFLFGLRRIRRRLHLSTGRPLT